MKSLARRFGVTFVGLGVLGLAGCGGAPYAMNAEAAVPTAEPASVYVIIEPIDEATPGVSGKKDGWVPEVFPAPNPFSHLGTWVGDYDCRQGNTGVAFRILDVRGRVVRAIFDFHHAPSGAAGAYLMSGTYDPETRRAHFEPSEWIVRPENYYMVGMDGEVSLDGSLFAGKMTNEGCGAFQLKPTR